MPSLKTGNAAPVALVLNTETTLATVTDVGTYVTRLDLVNLAAGDVIELRIYAKPAAAGDTERLHTGPVAFAHPTTEKLLDSNPVISLASYRVTLRQTAGVARVIPWWILAV